VTDRRTDGRTDIITIASTRLVLHATPAGVSAIYLGLFFVGGDALPQRDAFAGGQGGQLVEWTVNLSDTLIVRVSVVVQHDDLERAPRQLRRRHVEDELFLELRTQRPTVNAALQLAPTVRQQTQPTERIGRAAEVTRYQISSLYR